MLPPTGLLELLRWLLRRRKRYRVTGNSMRPLLVPGDEVLADPNAYRGRVPLVGEIVVAPHPHTPGLKIIKRVAAVHPDGYVHLRGDNPDESTDYTLPVQAILARVTESGW